jgi:NAD(P)H-dependent flavin oxidoreductase YrpB (nitropropane dioxygenase family)
VSALLDRLGVELPVVQAGMGGGLSGAALAAAVSEAGGLGTIGTTTPDGMRAEIAAARELTDRPIAANVLLPYARPEHWKAVAGADVVVTFWGRPRRQTTNTWLHQVGSEREARAAAAAGADGVIAQGVEAGGHVRGTTPAHDLLAQLRMALSDGFPILLAGGIADPADVVTALERGADAAVLGTRFVMSEESNALPAYKQRLMESRETVLTELFGMGWPARHRVIWNEAAERWLDSSGQMPSWLRTLQRVSLPVVTRLPIEMQARLTASQTPSRPFFGPFTPTVDRPGNLLDAGALYAGESVARIHDVRPAAEIVRELAPGA